MNKKNSKDPIEITTLNNLCFKWDVALQFGLQSIETKL